MKKLKYAALLLAFVALSGCNKYADAFLKIPQGHDNVSFDALGGSVRVPVNCNYEFSFSVDDSAKEWCIGEIVGQSVKITANPMTDSAGDRTATVTVNSLDCPPVKFTVQQTAVTVKNAPERYVLTNNVLGFSLQVISGTPLTFTYPSWVNPVDAGWEAGDKTYTFSAAIMTDASLEKREGELTVNGGSFSMAIPIIQTNKTNVAMLNLSKLWESSPFDIDDTRYGLLSTMEGYCNAYSRDQFRSYLAMTAENAAKQEQDNSIMSCYRYAFENVLEGVKTTTVENGSVVVWELYNMGFVVKTHSVCFGIDVNHRYAIQLEPYLDFLLITHSDSDHVDDNLQLAMVNDGKPVVSNFYTLCPNYCSTSAANYEIKGVSIRTCITDESASEPACTNCYLIKLPADAGGFTMVHPGDSSFDPSQYTVLTGQDVDLLVLRYGNKAEANILGTTAGKVNPSKIVFSHLEELRHYPTQSPMRASILGAVNNRVNLGAWSSKTGVPFWGQKMVWKDGVFVE